MYTNITTDPRTYSEKTETRFDIQGSLQAIILCTAQGIRQSIELTGSRVKKRQNNSIAQKGEPGKYSK